MARGFVYLAAVIDWHRRRALAWRLSISMDRAFCTEAVEEAMARYGKPEIFNVDQGSQATSNAFTGLLREHVVYFSHRCLSLRPKQPDPAGSTYESSEPVQTNDA